LPPESHYFRSEGIYKPQAAAALEAQFAGRSEFEAFYASLLTPERKNLFLRAASFYLYLVKQGDWHVSVDSSNPVVDYLTNSYKVVGLFSLIESLSNEEHEDFYQWLAKQAVEAVFPIKDRAQLNELYATYKLAFGSIRRCAAFFERLPEARQRQLRESVLINGVPIASTKKLAEFLYTLRSKFVHEAELVLQVGDFRLWSQTKKGITETVLPVPLLCAAFEEGLVAYFRDET
jgi:hypothetical protein